MAQTLSEGIVIPNADGGEQISATGVVETRTQGITTNAALVSLRADAVAGIAAAEDSAAAAEDSAAVAAQIGTLADSTSRARDAALEGAIAGMEGMTYVGAWDSGVTYRINDVVTHGGDSWARLTTGATGEPGASPADWGLVARKGDGGGFGELAETATVGLYDTVIPEIPTAYDVAVEHGFSGTPEEWLESQRGPAGPEGPYGGTAVTDPQVASYVTTSTATKAALDQAYVRGINVIAHGAVGDGVADDRAAIQAAIDLGAATGQDVILPAGKTFRTTSHITLSSPVRVDGRGATLRAEGASSAVVIASSYVTVEGLSIVGNGAGVFAAANRGILSMGTAATPFTGVHLVDVSVSGMTDTAIRCDWWTDSSIAGGRLSDLAYAGIIAQSAQRLRVEGVSVEDVWQHTADQSYGISITDSVNTEAGRSRDVTVNACTVANVANWTGLSTHGGERVSFTNNRVLGCYRGIIYGAGNPTRVVAATDGLVTGNIIDGAGAGGSTGLGVIGQSTGARSTALRAGNLVKNHAKLFEASTNGVWFDDAQVLGSDAGFPVAKAGVALTEEVVDRITVPPSSFVRRVSVVASVYATSTISANRCDIRVYAGSTNIGTTRRALAGSGLPESIPGVGSAEIPASTTPTVIEVRAVLNSGTGTMTTSAAGGLTTTTVTVARV